MYKCVLLLAAVAAVSASPLLEVDLLKRLLSDMVNADLEKRAMQLYTFDAPSKKLTVSFQACVMGDRSRTPCRDVKGHRLQIFNSKGEEELSTQTKYLDNYVGPRKTFYLPFVKDGEKYTAKACEIAADNSDIMCNEGSFEGGKTVRNAFGGRTTNLI